MPVNASVGTVAQPAALAAVPLQAQQQAQAAAAVSGSVAAAVAAGGKTVAVPSGSSLPPAASGGPPCGLAVADTAGAGYDILEGSASYLLEDLERKGLDAKSYIQTMLRLLEDSFSYYSFIYFVAIIRKA